MSQSSRGHWEAATHDSSRGISLVLKSVPALANIHAGGLVRLLNEKDNGCPPACWNFARQQGALCVVRGGSSVEAQGKTSCDFKPTRF